MASGGGQGSNGVNGGEYLITISKEGGDVRNDESFHMIGAIKDSLTGILNSESEDNPFKSLSEEVKQVEIKGQERESRSEDKELENRLGNSLEEIIITLATFFIYFISFLGSFQQPSHDHFRFTVVGVLVGVIWIFTVALIVIWWCKLKYIKVEIDTLEGREKHLPKWHSCRVLIVILGIVVTLFSVYFAYILYSQWLSGSSPAPSPSALPTFQLPSTPVATQYDAIQ